MIKNTLKKTLGVLLIILGIIGLFLPFLQGILLISLGIILIDKPLYEKIKAKLGLKK